MSAGLRHGFFITLSVMASIPGRPAGQTTSPDDPRVNPTAAAVAEFNEEVAEYVELHQRIENELPPLTRESTPDQILQHQAALAARIRAARKNAEPGDIFDSHVGLLFRGIIARELQRPGVRNALREDNPGARRLRVNGAYPSSVPVTSVPPSLLFALPAVPEEVEFRFVGRDLILRDTQANLIVDFLRNALK